MSELLSPYLDGQVTLPERHAVDTHLAECEACRAELEDLRAVRSALRQLPKHASPRSFVLGPRSVRPAALSGTLGGFARAVTSIAASLAVVALSVTLAMRGLPHQSTTSASAALASASGSLPASLPPSPVLPSPALAKPAAAAARPAPSAAAPAAQGAPANVGAPASVRQGADGSGVDANAAAASPARSAAVARLAPAGTAAAGSGAAAASAGAPSRTPFARESQDRPINVPRLIGELAILLAALGLALYSIRWWRIR